MKHEIKPVFNDKSRILILGSFPSVKSREGQFFYHHPQNRFWKVLAASLSQSVPATVEEKTIFLLSNHIAVWDVIASCDIQGSSDSSIRNAAFTPTGELPTNYSVNISNLLWEDPPSNFHLRVRPMRHGHWNVSWASGAPPSGKVYFPENRTVI